MTIETHLLDDPMWMILLFAFTRKKNLNEESFMIALPSFLTPLAVVVARSVFARKIVVFFSLYPSLQFLVVFFFSRQLFIFFNLQNFLSFSKVKNVFHFFSLLRIKNRLLRIIFYIFLSFFRHTNYIHFFFFSQPVPHCNNFLFCLLFYYAL